MKVGSISYNMAVWQNGYALDCKPKEDRFDSDYSLQFTDGTQVWLRGHSDTVIGTNIRVGSNPTRPTKTKETKWIIIEKLIGHGNYLKI